MAGESNAENIIGDYSALIEGLKLSPEEIRDEQDLSHPKQAIIDALLAAYSLSGRSSHSPSRLQGWLLTLAQFQPGVGEPIRDPAAEIARRMTAAAKTDAGADPQRIASEVAEESAEQGWAVRRARLQGKVDKERNRLIGLLQDVR
jgi:hypothetical protein